MGKFFGDPIFAVRSNGDGFQRELEGACNQESLKVDRYITKELTNNLFGSKKFENDSIPGILIFLILCPAVGFGTSY